MPRRKVKAGDLPTMPECCATCFFHPTNGDPAGQASVISRTFLKGSLYCHKDQLVDRPPTHLCKGMRDLTCHIMFRMGLLPEPTDAAFRAESARRLGGAQ
jgi:hypothetical protein